MSWISRSASLYRRLRHRRQAEEELDTEVHAYFEILAERNVARGVSPEEARRAARVEFEGPEQVKERVREVRVGAAIETTLEDFRYAFRVLRKSPGFTTIAVLTLALGIGANTAIFSLINAVMLRLLPVAHPEQLVLLTDPGESGTSVDTSENGVRSTLSYPEFDRLRLSKTGAFSDMFAAQNEVSNLEVFLSEGSGIPRAARAHTQLVSGEFFGVLGVQPILGRAFTPEEDKAPGANPVAVVSYDFWQREYGGETGVVDNTIRLGQAAFRILGVAPPGFRGILVGSETDIWLPITMQQQVLPGRNYLEPRDTLWLQVMARLAPGVSMKSAEAGINVSFQQALREWGSALPAEKQRRSLLDQKIELRPGARGASALRGEFSDPLVILMAMVGVVLLIACANIANLMLVRARGRQREIGVRLALGAARARLIRQLLTESLIVAAIGGMLGIGLSIVGTRLLMALVATGVTDFGLEVPRDYRVLLFTALISLVTALLFGLAPAVRATRLDVNQTLAANVRGSIGGRGRLQTTRMLAVAQVALSLVLLLGAALFLRSLHNKLAENVGFDRNQLLMVRLDPVAAGYKGASVTTLYENVREALRTIPGVRGATVSNKGLFGGDSTDHLAIEGSLVRDPDQLASRWTEIGPDYFKTLGIPILLGREINSGDSTRGMPVCVINEAFARRFFPDSTAIGKHITDTYPTTRETFEIVGIVADAREHEPSERKRPRFYANLTHPIGAVQSVTFLLNTAGDPSGVASAVRQTIRQMDPNLPVLSLRSVNEQLDRRLTAERLIAQLAACFGAVALFMAAIGLYGVMSYSISRRASEIGIRMALGASGRKVIGMVLGETLRIVAIGSAIGLLGALALGRLIASRLYGLTASDPAAIGLTVLTIVMAAVLAGYLPARRASRIDPMVALRND
jgi:predicted permease